MKIRILRRQHLLGSIDCIDSIDSIESEDSTDSIDSIDFIGSIDSILVPQKRPPTFTPHAKGKSYYQRRRPQSLLSNAPFACGVNAGGL